MNQEFTMQRLKVYHLDDDLFALKRVREYLCAVGDLCEFEVFSHETEESLWSSFDQGNLPDVVLLDVHLGKDKKGRGIAVASSLRSRSWHGAIVVHSNDFATIRDSILAGANDFVLKTDSLEGLALRLFTAHRQLAALPNQDTQDRKSAKPIVGNTMRSVAKRLKQIQNSAIRAIHITGESGTGKEVVADLWYACQPDKSPFLKVNCAAISPNLLESELFGHARGAFTGALTEKVGYVEAASGGSLFLDEVACLSPSAQAALLRALENREIIRVGETKPRPVDVKILSASNIPLEKLIDQGLFRNDLLQRLREAEVPLPPLRERKDEIDEFIEHFCKTEAGGPYVMADEAKQLLAGATWKDGNIRALRNAVRAMTEHHVDRRLSPTAVPAWVWKQVELQDNKQTAGRAIAKDSGTDSSAVSLHIEIPDGRMPLFDTLSDMMLVEAIRYLRDKAERHSLRAIGEALGIPKTTLATKMNRIRERGLMSEREINTIDDGKSK